MRRGDRGVASAGLTGGRVIVAADGGSTLDSAPALILDPSQERAVDLMCDPSEGIVVITGGPGVGKSTCLKAALDRFDAARIAFELAAPTGKAARRMRETTGREARTIHRLLEYGPGVLGEMGFRRSRTRPLECRVVIIDESSMVDVELGAALLSAIDPAVTRLVLIGDANQLPPVGPGRLFGELVDAEAVPVARLTTLHRSALTSWIHVSAQAMLRGQLPELEPHDRADGQPDFRFAECASAEWILPKIRRLMTEVFPARINAQAQVLIPQRPGVAGIDAANRALQDALNPRREGEPWLPRTGWELRHRDRVIQTRNDYQLEVFNGETGEVTEITPAGVTVLFAGRPEPVTYTVEQSGSLQLAYALTVHRSQGSEFPWVIAVVHSTHSYILNRQLVYTAITRAREGVVLVGDRKGLERALTGRMPRRNSTLVERLTDRLEPANDLE